MKELVLDLHKYRALVWALTERQLSARYRGSVLGMLWSFLNPLCLMAVYTLVFHYYIRFDQVGNYSIFLFCGLLPWLWVTSAFIEGCTAISSGGSLITKSLFPAHLLPMVSVLTTCVHFLLSLPLLFLFMLVAGVPIPWTVVFLPFIIGIQFIFLYGAVLALSALNVYFRDIQHLVGNVLQFLFFLCPILYPLKVVPEAFQPFVVTNPFAVFTMVYQGILLDGVAPTITQITFISAWAGINFLIGIVTYRAYRESFAEVL